MLFRIGDTPTPCGWYISARHLILSTPRSSSDLESTSLNEEAFYPEVQARQQLIRHGCDKWKSGMDMYSDICGLFLTTSLPPLLWLSSQTETAGRSGRHTSIFRDNILHNIFKSDHSRHAGQFLDPPSITSGSSTVTPDNSSNHIAQVSSYNSDF